jgi:hypothetical protein
MLGCPFFFLGLISYLTENTVRLNYKDHRDVVRMNRHVECLLDILIKIGKCREIFLKLYITFLIPL